MKANLEEGKLHRPPKNRPIGGFFICCVPRFWTPVLRGKLWLFGVSHWRVSVGAFCSGNETNETLLKSIFWCLILERGGGKKFCAKRVKKLLRD